MRVSCLQENLKKGLGIVGRAVPTRTTLPITNNVLLATDQSRLKLVATNLEIAISCWIGAKVEEEGSITIPARLLTEFVNSLPSERIDITTTADHKVQIRCGGSEAEVTGMDAEKFPPIPEVSASGGLFTRIDPQTLRSAIAQVEFAAADDSRPILTGIHCRFEGDEVTMAAADGFRLAVHRTPLLSPVPDETAVVIPVRVLRELRHLLLKREEPVEVVANGDAVLFRLEGEVVTRGYVELVSQLLQGTFPNYPLLIPQETATRVVVDRAGFLQAVRRAFVAAKAGSGIVRLHPTPGSMVIAAQAEEVGKYSVKIDAVVIGEGARIAFYGRDLLDVLAVIDTGQVALEINSASSPGVIKPVGVENYVHVVMPRFVQWEGEEDVS